MTDFNEIRKLFDIWDNSFGIPEHEILECENRLGAKLPRVLRDFYLQFGNNEQINQTQDYLILPAELEVYEDGFVVFYYENQVVWEAGIKFSDFNQDNPNIYLSYDRENWEFEIGNLFNFLTAETYLQALFALPFNANKSDIGEEREIFVRQNWQTLELKSNLWETDFFQNSPDEILALMKSENQVDIFIAAKNEEKFNQINEELGIDWDYNSLEDE